MKNNIMKLQHLTACIIVAFFVFPFQAFAETYSEAVTHAQNNIDNNTNFIPSDSNPGNTAIILIPQSGSTDFGLTYQNYSGTNYLSSRTFAKSKNLFNTTTQTLTGVGDFTITGSATSDAAWVTVGNDTTRFLDGQSVTAATVTKTLERGLGMNDNASHNMIIEYAVLPNDNNIMRPSRKPTIASYSTTSSDYTYSANYDNVTDSAMDPTVLANLKAYLTGWQKDALGTLDAAGNPTWHDLRPQAGHEKWGRFPFSELGYTYFWNSGGTDLKHIQGMTEFIILGGTSVKIMGIYSPQSYLYTKNKGGVFSSAADAQYGNGFPNFNITGSCDTVWAGNSFQKNVSTTNLTPNTITVDAAGSVSGGQGILVWSTNYLVTNNGVISGTTQNKLYYDSQNSGLTGTANIAVLFKGNADASGINQFVNTGSVSSSGTAIQADAGNTTITNNGSGVISGDDYAILTAAGNDTVNINGGELTGSVDLGTGTDSFTVSTGSNATLNFYLDRDTQASAQIVNAETVDIADNTTLGVYAAGGTKNFRDNEQFLIAEATTLTATSANLLIQNDITLPMVTFSASKTGSKLYLTAARDATYYQANSGNSSLGAALDTLADSASGEMSEIIGALDDTGDATNAQKLEPVAASPIINTMIQALNNFGNVFSVQMARLGNHDDSDVEVYAVNDGKRKRLPASAVKNMLAYNSNSILENSFDRPQKWEVFATGFGVMGFQSNHPNAVGYESGGGGTQFGFYRRANDQLMLGMLAGYMFDNVRLNQESGSQDINSVRIGPCGKWLRGNLYATGAVTYGYHAVQGNRKIQFGMIDLQADSDYNMQDVSPFLETGYILRPGKNLEIVPNVSLQYDWMRSQSYNESGAEAADLSVKAFSSNSLISVIGLRFNGRVDMKSVVFLPEFNVGWQHEYLGRVGDINASFPSESAGSFTTHLNVFDRNAVRAGVGANFIYGKNHNVFSLQYNSEIYDSASNHVFSLTCRNYF